MTSKAIDVLKNSKAYFEDFITRSTYNSNAIEGSTLTYANTYAIIFNDESFKITATSREIYEAINHKYAINHIIHKHVENLTQKFIVDIVKTINKNILEVEGFRNVNVLIRGSEHIPPDKTQIYNLMMYFIDNYNNTVFDSVFEKIATMHIEFEKIHPFIDGNGRTGRLLINYELLKNGLAPCVIPVEDRSIYFEFINRNDVQGFAKYIEDKVKQEEVRIEQIASAEAIGDRR
ncbi:MAG: Fic family protein [Candidatus Ancillula sp.]|jgi:Fic family protein|nr:Fic family protein [Candidatus Ancillula sp.]